jgi:glycosyltransferase involved in cell wall biosynthesis
VEPIVEILSELLTDSERRDRMGEAGRAWVVDKFDWSVLSRQAEHIFAETLVATRRNRATRS